MSTGFGICYSPAEGQDCAECGGLVTGVYIESEDKPYCRDCTEFSDDEFGEIAVLASGLGDIDTAFRMTALVDRPGMLEDTQRIMLEITRTQCPQGTGRAGDDLTFALELFDRASVADLGGDQLHQLLGKLCPTVTLDAVYLALRERHEAGQVQIAQGLARVSQMEVVLLLCRYVPKETTLKDAVYRLGIDPEKFSGLVTIRAAESGTAIKDLPPDVVDECLAAAKAKAA